MLNEAKTSRPRQPRGRGRYQDYEVEAEAKNNYMYEKNYQIMINNKIIAGKINKIPEFSNFTRFLHEKYPIT